MLHPVSQRHRNRYKLESRESPRQTTTHGFSKIDGTSSGLHSTFWQIGTQGAIWSSADKLEENYRKKEAQPRRV